MMDNVVDIQGRPYSRKSSEAESGDAREHSAERRLGAQKRLLDALQKRPYIRQPLVRARVAQNLHGILERVDREHGVPKRDIVRAVGFGEVLSPTKALWTYTMRPDMPAERAKPRMSKLSQKAGRYHQIAQEAARAIGRDQDYFLLELFQGTSYEAGDLGQEFPNHLYEFVELVERMTDWVIREAKLEAFFKGVYELPLQYDVRTDALRMDSPQGMLDTYLDDSAICADECPPLPSTLIYEEQRGEFPARLKLTEPQARPFWGLLPLSENEDPPEVLEELRVRFRAWTEVRLSIGPVTEDRRLGPLFETRLCMTPLFEGEEDSNWWLNPYGDNTDLHHLWRGGRLFNAYWDYEDPKDAVEIGEEHHFLTQYFYYAAVTPASCLKHLFKQPTGSGNGVVRGKGVIAFGYGRFGLGDGYAVGFPVETVGAFLERSLCADSGDNSNLALRLLEDAKSWVKRMDEFRQQIDEIRQNNHRRALARWEVADDDETR